jgi:hypothetical protein
MQQYISQKQGAGNEPDNPSRNANAPSALFHQQMMYLWAISYYDERCSRSTYDFHFYTRN